MKKEKVLDAPVPSQSLWWPFDHFDQSNATRLAAYSYAYIGHWPYTQHIHSEYSNKMATDCCSDNSLGNWTVGVWPQSWYVFYLKGEFINWYNMTQHLWNNI